MRFSVQTLRRDAQSIHEGLLRVRRFRFRSTATVEVVEELDMSSRATKNGASALRRD